MDISTDLEKPIGERLHIAALHIDRLNIRCASGLAAILTVLRESKIALAQALSERIERTAKGLGASYDHLVMRGLFTGHPPTRDEFIERVSASLSVTTQTHAEMISESSALVFAHSIVDDFLSDIVDCAALCNPTPFTDKLQGAQVSLKEALDASGQTLLFRKLHSRLTELRKESMRKRLDIFLGVARVRDFGWDQPFEPGKLQEFDALRQRIVHRMRFGHAAEAEQWLLWSFSFTNYLGSFLRVEFDLGSHSQPYNDSERDQWFARPKAEGAS